MKASGYIIVLVVFTFVAVSAIACGNSASAPEDEAPDHNPMVHDDHQGHDMSDMAKTPASEKGDVTPKNGFDGMPAPGTKATCPVMGNDFEVTAKTEYSEYKGKTYVFCCPGCKPKFEENPEKYI